MDPALFKAVQPHLDKIAEVVNQRLDTPELRLALSQLSQTVGKELAVSLNLILDVYDEEHDRSLPLLTTGLSTDAQNEPYRTWCDCSPQRYVVDEGIRIVPHDRCPKCWDVWDFKFRHPTCSHCGTKLGQDCKVLIESDECPLCQEGKVSVSRPRCDKCRFEVDPKIVVWG